MAVNKNFVVKNGLEVNTKLIRADATNNKVGIGTSVANYELHVNGGIGATDVHVSGMTTILNELNVGLGGTVLTVLGTGDQFVGINTASPQFRLDVRSPVSTGQTALYVYGDMRVTGDIELDDINLDDATIQNLTVTEALNVSNSGLSTFSGRVDFNDSVDIEDNLIVAGIATVTKDLTVSSNAIVSGFTTITGAATLSSNAIVAGLATVTGATTLSSSATVGATLGVTGAATLSSNLIVAGLSTFSGITTFSHRVGVTTDFVVDGNTTLTGLTTITGAIDANGGANIAGGLVANSAAVSDLTDNRVVIAGASGELEDDANFTFDGSTLTLGKNLNATGVSTITRLDSTDVNVVGVVTAASFVGGGQIGVRNEGTFVGTGVTMVDFKSSSSNNTVDFDATAGIATVTVTTGVSLGLAIALGG